MNMLGFERPVYAPLVADILKDPQEMRFRDSQPLYVARQSQPLSPNQKYARSDGWIEVTSESVALKELDTYLESAADILQAAGQKRYRSSITAADTLRHNLRLICAVERALAEQVIAEHWLASVYNSRDGELYVYAAIEESASLIFQSVRDRVARLDPDAAAVIYPFDAVRQWIELSALERMNRNGIKIVDDWTMTAQQLRSRINDLTSHQIPLESIEANYLCASEQHIKEGVGGVPVLSVWKYPHLANPHSGDASLVGSHAVPDYGSCKEVEKIRADVLRYGRDSIADSSPFHFLPGILSIARVYSPFESHLDQRGEPSGFTAFNETVNAFNQMRTAPLPPGITAL
jgi:hypothetical protein